MSISNLVRDQIKRGSWIRKMFEEGLRLKQEHGPENVFDFTLGNPCIPPPDDFHRALEKVVREERPGVHAYMQNSGFPATRSRVARDLAVETALPFSADHVVMTVGAAGALNVALKSVLDPGDEVVLIAPYFAEYAFYVSNHGGTKVVSRARPDFLPDLDDLDARIGPRTKALILNSPCNPSGRLIPAGVLARLGDLLRRKSRRHGRTIYLLSDEPYRRLLFDGLEFASPFAHYEDTLMAMSHSKDLSLAGERIGYLAISPRCAAAADLFSAATFTNRTLGYVNAPALMQRMIAVIDRIRPDVAVYERKRDILFRGLTAIGYDVVKPDGTFFMFPKCPVPDDLEFVRTLASRLVLVTPGSGFEYPGCFRIAFCVPDDVIERSLPRFEEAFKAARGA
ncbi:MAG: pyridoxal phosphate-dependent aminotransferase [Deltaproteobacteria bacterium]|nr:pyridoxal phosphate-dependent aminotransferase [Deltaproteobacteria bacterium]